MFEVRQKCHDEGLNKTYHSSVPPVVRFSSEFVCDLRTQIGRFSAMTSDREVRMEQMSAP